MRKFLCGLAALGVMGVALVAGQPQAAQAGEVAPAVQQGDVEFGYVYDSSWYTYEFALARARQWNRAGYDTLTIDRGGMYHVYVRF
jgi:hypothetical protein